MVMMLSGQDATSLLAHVALPPKVVVVLVALLPLLPDQLHVIDIP